MLNKDNIEVDRKGVGFCEMSVLSPNGTREHIIMEKKNHVNVVFFKDEKGFQYELPDFCVLDVISETYSFKSKIPNKKVDSLKLADIISKYSFKNEAFVENKYGEKLKISDFKSYKTNMFWPNRHISFIEGNLVINY